MKIPTEDLTDVTMAIGDTYGDDVRGGNVGGGYGGNVQQNEQGSVSAEHEADECWTLMCRCQSVTVHSPIILT